MSADLPPRRIEHVPSLPARGPMTHKGELGRVAILAGSRGMSGAALLCALGALRGGAGLVRVVTPLGVQPLIASAEPCCMTLGLAEDAHGQFAVAARQQLQETLAWASVAAIGPGIGQGEGVREVVSELLLHFRGPLIVDADGLNTLASLGDWPTLREPHAPLVLTPHPGEMRRLLEAQGCDGLSLDGDDARLNAAATLAHYSGAIVVLKGHRTLVFSTNQFFVNETGNAGMASGGMGDVLTGLLASLVGQGLAPFDAAVLAVHAHGAAGDDLALRVGPIGFLARDLAQALPTALAARIEKPRFGFR